VRGFRGSKLGGAKYTLSKLMYLDGQNGIGFSEHPLEYCTIGTYSNVTHVLEINFTKLTSLSEKSYQF
jgi:hypothetical protein